MGKIPESTPLKISDFVLRFRESSKKFVVEILTQNFAFNLSGALFFIGLGSSLKWWYKDQLLIALLKQNLPALSEPQQKLSWETGEYLIGEQTRQFLKKKRDTIFNNSISSAHCIGDGDQSIFSNGSKNQKIESSSFTSPTFTEGDVKEIHASKMLRKTPTMLVYNQQDSEINAHPFNHLIERIDVYSNSVIVNFKSPWQKHAYHRFVGIFPELVRARSLGLVESPLCNGINSDQTKTFPFQKYTFWEPPKNWFKISARDLFILNEESNLKPRIWTFFGKKMVHTLHAHSQCTSPTVKEGAKKVIGVDFVDEIHNINVVNVKQKGIAFFNKVNNKALSFLTPLTSAANNFADSTILNTSLAELSAVFTPKGSCSVNQVNTLLMIDKVDQKKVMKKLTIIGKLSYPLELTRTMDGWQPSIETLLLSSYLDEIPYKLGSTLSSFLCKKENQSILTIVESSSTLIDRKTKKYPILSFKGASILKNCNKETHSQCTSPTVKEGANKVIPEFLIFFSDDQITNSAGESRYTSCFAESGGLVLTTQSKLSNHLLWRSNRISKGKSNQSISNDSVTSSPSFASPSVKKGDVNFAVHEDKRKVGIYPVEVQQIQKSNKQKINRVDKIFDFNQTFNEIKQRKSHGIPRKGSANLNKNETLLKKWQLVEIKQLLKNELQILVNSLPLIFVDRSSTSGSKHETGFFIKSYNQYSTNDNQGVTISDKTSSTSCKDNLYNFDTTNKESASLALPSFTSPTVKEGDMKEEHVKQVQKNYSTDFVNLGTQPEQAKLYTANKKELLCSVDDDFYGIEDNLYGQLREPLTPTGSRDKPNVNGINKEADFESKIQSKEITNTKQKISPASSLGSSKEKTKNGQLNLTEKSNLKSVSSVRNEISNNIDVGFTSPTVKEGDSKDYNDTFYNKSLATFSSGEKENPVDSFSLLDSLGITFNNLSPLKNPPILLPMHQDASFWMWNKEKTKKVNSQLFSSLSPLVNEIRNNDIASYTTFSFDPKILMWQVLSYDQHVKGLKKPIEHINKIILKQKKTTIRNIDNINLVDNEINLTNKKAKLMSGYVYPDTQSNYLKSNLYRWIQLQSFRFLGDEKTFFNAPSQKHKIKQSWFPFFDVVKHGSPKVMSEVFNLIKHSPGFFKNTNQLDKLDKKRNFKKRNQSGDSYKKESFKDCISIQLLPDGNVIPRKKTNSPKSQFLFLKFPLKNSDNNLKERLNSHCKATLEMKPNFHDWLLYPKLFQGINKFMDEACLFGLEIPISPTTIPFYALDSQNNHQRQNAYTRFYDQMNKVDSQEKTNPFNTNTVGNHGTIKDGLFVQKKAAFPLLQKKINTIATNTPFGCTGIAFGEWNGNFSKSSFDDLYFVFHSVKENESNINIVDDQNQRKNVIKETDQWKFDHHLALFPGFTKPNQFLSSITQIAQGNDISENDFPHFYDMSALGLGRQAILRKQNVSLDQPRSIKVNNQQNKNNNFIIDCSPRKTAYRGVVAQRDKFTKDFQSCTQKIKLRSILGTALFGPETPLTDRQSHFFGQKRLSTVDVNDFQRDYLRQLGKETLAQSNPKGKPEDSTSVERVKILSFSKAINSFFLKKRKYTYLLDEKDQWHLLFQEQLRTALEDTKRYPPLTPEEAKDHGPGRIKVSAPLMMARFPKRRHSHKVLAHFRENGIKRGSPWLLMLTKSPITSTFFTSSSFTEGDVKDGDVKEFLLPEIVSHYPVFTETYNSQLSSVPRFNKSSLPFFNNLQWFTQEPLNANSWSVISQWSFLVALLFWIEQTFLRDVFPALFALEQLLLGVNGIKSSDRTHVIRVSQGDTPKFKDIAGVDGLLGELAELVLFLRGHKERLWNKKNSYGVLLTGPPGTGKTFLVRALANEAKVPVLILSAGTLAANKTNNSKPSWSIRHAFRRAKQLAPCILFIDEIDALGRSRGKIVTDINEIVADTNLNQNQRVFSATPLASSKIIGIENSSNASNFGSDQEQPLSSQESLGIHQIEGTKGIAKQSKGYAIDRITGITSSFSVNGEGREYSEIDRYSLCEDETGKISNKIPSVSDKTLSTPKENVKRQFGPLTQLLVSMDGVSNLSGVLIMGATNRPESLDPALTRPGRFERIIRVEKPAEQKRIEILQLYSRNLGVQQQIPWSYLANRTVGLTAADLAVAMNYSSLKAILQKTTHTIETIEYGLDSIARSFNRSSIRNKTSKHKSFSYSFHVQSLANCKKRRLTKSLEIQNIYKNQLFVDVIRSIWWKNNSSISSPSVNEIQRNKIKNPPDFSLQPLVVQADNDKVEDQKKELSTTFNINEVNKKKKN